MAHMEKDHYSGLYYVVDAGRGGRHFIPCEVHFGAETNADLQPYVEDHVDAPEDAPTVKKGLLVRYTARGYLDSTPWEPVYRSSPKRRRRKADDKLPLPLRPPPSVV